MSSNSNDGGTSRRRFLGTLAAGAGAVGMATLPFQFPASADAETPGANPENPDAWFNGINGKHRAVFDVSVPDGPFPFLGPRVFLLTNEKTGTPAKDCSVVVVVRHEAVPLVLGSTLWAKYRIGEATKVMDPDTNAPATRNIFWEPKSTDFVFPVMGHVRIGVNELAADGVRFFACDAALTAMSAGVAQKTNQEASAVKQEFLANLLPGVHAVPSGVWALGRAQEHGCAYCYGF